MAVPRSLFHLFPVSFFILIISSSIPIDAVNGGFSVELIHRDSPKSPLYNPAETHYDRIINGIRRSIRGSKAADSVEPPLRNYRGEYLMEVSMGTPPHPLLVIPDINSDIIWTQCLPCGDCYRQTAPIFDPSKSRTYHNIPCSSKRCPTTFGRSSCSAGECVFSIIDNDISQSYGNVAVDIVTIGSQHSFPDILFECGHDNRGTYKANVSGIMGLGRGNNSLVTQMGSIGAKFSFCFAPINAAALYSSKLNFGANAEVSGAGTVSTPISSTNPFSYELTIEAISVGAIRIPFVNPSAPDWDGNIIMDYGTAITKLPLSFYFAFATAVANEITLERVKDPSRFVLDHCFRSQTDNFSAPVITVHFKGADLVLSWTNVFVRVASDVVCFAFRSLANGPAVFGSIAQTNFLTGYDIRNMMVSFKPADCTALHI